MPIRGRDAAVTPSAHAMCRFRTCHCAFRTSDAKNQLSRFPHIKTPFRTSIRQWVSRQSSNMVPKILQLSGNSSMFPFRTLPHIPCRTCQKLPHMLPHIFLPHRPIYTPHSSCVGVSIDTHPLQGWCMAACPSTKAPPPCAEITPHVRKHGDSYVLSPA